jgi:hypothetical protein
VKDGVKKPIYNRGETGGGMEVLGDRTGNDSHHRGMNPICLHHNPLSTHVPLEPTLEQISWNDADDLLRSFELAT